MLSFHLATGVTLGYIFCNVSLQTIPPKSFFHIHIHLSISGVNRIRRFVSFLQNQLSQISILWYTNTLSEPDGSLLIFTKICVLAFSQGFLQGLSDFHYSFVSFLSFSNSIHQQWLYHQRGNKTFRHNFQTEVSKCYTQVLG